MSAKVSILMPGYLAFSCPGCRMSHAIKIGGENGNRWNNNFGYPSLRDAFSVDGCKGTVTDGVVQYALDCFHDMAGKTVSIPDWSDRV